MFCPLVRSGLWGQGEFFADLGQQITALQTRPARLWQSVEESSLTAWFEKYALYERPEYSISYYGKGQLLGVGLDLVIRDATDNRASLDDVLRRLKQQYAQRGRFYPDSQGVRIAAEEVIREAKPEATTDLRLFFGRYVSGTDELPFALWLSIAGLTIRISGERWEVEELPQATERQRRILAGLLSGGVTANTLPAANRFGGR
jgi:predicted metalloprotease with PDZ domain